MAGFDARAYAQKIANSKPAGSGNPIRDGDFLFAIKNLSVKPSDKGSQTWFIAEFLTIKSAPVDVAPDMITTDKPIVAPNAPGSTASMVVDLNSQMGPANVKEIAAAVWGKKHSDLTEDDFVKFLSENVDLPGDATGKAQPLMGRVMSCKTTRKLVQSGANKGKPAVRLGWGHVEQSPEEVAAIRGMMIPKSQ
jgi:hypothetical protein